MLPTRLTILAAVAVAATLTLAACGGDDDGGNDDEADITAAIEASATENDPANCTELQTQAFTEQSEFATGEEAVAACEEDTDDPAADSVAVENIEVDGDSATAEVAVTGSGLDGQTIGVSLAKEDDQWKLDSFDEFVAFDKDAFVGAFVEELRADPEVPAEIATCVEDELNAADDAAIESGFLSGDQNELLALFGTCFEGA